MARTITLDQYVERTQQPPDFIKIDVESAEQHVIRGALNTLRTYKPIIAIEVGDVGVKGTVSNHDLIEEIVALGYCPYEFSNGTFIPQDLQDNYSIGNVLLLPEQHTMPLRKNGSHAPAEMAQLLQRA